MATREPVEVTVEIGEQEVVAGTLWPKQCGAVLATAAALQVPAGITVPESPASSSCGI